jgi:hypothetical protein
LGTLFLTTRFKTLLSASRFLTAKIHVKTLLGAAVDGQAFVTAMPTAVVDSVPSVPLVRGMLLSDRVEFHRCWLWERPATSGAILDAHGVTVSAVPKEPVKSVPPSPRAPPVTKALKFVGSPTESFPSPATPLLCARTPGTAC